MHAEGNQLSIQRVCFGHQSVGANLIDGLTAVSGGRLNIVESVTPQTFEKPVFAHFRVGQNRDPLSKFREFASVINAGVGARVDAAFFKLCYVDITAETDIPRLFEAYRSVMDSLVRAYPGVTFLHVTVPLRRINGGLVGWVRGKFGGLSQEQEGQARRHQYNQLMRSTYEASGRLFDLAAEEATYSDGRSATFRYLDRAIPNFVSDYTDDGGHLNQPAAERIASRLLDFVASGGAVRGIRSERGSLP